jgi:hypothetical protein
MEATTAAPPQRVCPKCARISWATGPRCPYCTARFRRRGGLSPWALVAAVAIVLAGTAVMLVIAGRIYEDRLDDKVEQVNSDFEASLQRFQSDMRRELDARLPPAGAVTPTTTPQPTPSPTPDDEATASPTASPSRTATPSPTTGP